MSHENEDGPTTLDFILVTIAAVIGVTVMILEMTGILDAYIY